jgi:hypothetical protein
MAETLFGFWTVLMVHFEHQLEQVHALIAHIADDHLSDGEWNPEQLTLE